MLFCSVVTLQTRQILFLVLDMFTTGYVDLNFSQRALGSLNRLVISSSQTRSNLETIQGNIAYKFASLLCLLVFFHKTIVYDDGRNKAKIVYILLLEDKLTKAKR